MNFKKGDRFKVKHPLKYFHIGTVPIGTTGSIINDRYQDELGVIFDGFLTTEETPNMFGLSSSGWKIEQDQIELIAQDWDE